jgi:hypothetical protein
MPAVPMTARFRDHDRRAVPANQMRRRPSVTGPNLRSVQRTQPAGTKAAELPRPALVPLKDPHPRPLPEYRSFSGERRKSLSRAPSTGGTPVSRTAQP